MLEFEVEKSAMKVAQVSEPDLFWEYRAISNLRILVPSKPYNKDRLMQPFIVIHGVVTSLVIIRSEEPYR